MRLALQNPSDYPRGGIVELPWAPVLEAAGIPADQLRVVDDNGGPVAAQVISADPGDPGRDVLVLRLNGEIPPGTDDYGQTCAYLTLERAPASAETPEPASPVRTEPPAPASAGEEADGEAGEDAGGAEGDAEPEDEAAGLAYGGVPVARAERGGLRLRNRYLNLWMDLGGSVPWYRGAATSVVVTIQGNPYLQAVGGENPFLPGMESVPWWLLTETIDILESYTGMVTAKGHDEEKRCMQIDRVRLRLPATSPEPELVHYLAGSRYTLLGCSTGPLRAAAAIASEPFDYAYTDPLTGEARTIPLRLHRLLSLDEDADHVLDELSLRPDGDAAGTAPLPYFVPRYFTFMDMGRAPLISHFAHIPDWFSISAEGDPNQGYGFATDVHCEPVKNRVEPYPFPRKADRTFSWELGSGQVARCLHLFRFCPAPSMTEEAGRAWYAHIYKPLRARLETQEKG